MNGKNQIIKSYSDAITKQSGIAIFYNNRGYTYAKIGENENPLSDYSKAIELNPKYKEAYVLPLSY